VTTTTPAVGAPIARVEAREKVTGQARYAYEHPRDDVAYAWIVTAGIAKGRVRAIDAAPALAAGAVAVLSHENAPRLQPVDDGELRVLQSPAVSYRGQVVALVVAEELEAAREAARLVRVDYDQEPHDVLLRPGHPGLYRPEVVNPAFPADTARGDSPLSRWSDHTCRHLRAPGVPFHSPSRWRDTCVHGSPTAATRSM